MIHVVLRRLLIVVGVGIFVIPILTFACGISVVGLGPDAVRIVLGVGLTALALDARTSVAVLMVLIAIALRSGQIRLRRRN